MFHILRLNPDSKTVKLFEKGLSRILQSGRLLSYKHICGKQPLVYKTVGQLLDESAEKYGDRTAFVSVYQDQRITFREAKVQIDAIASGMFEYGIEKGDRVAIWAPNSVEWYLTSFALAKAGAISVYLNPAYQARELKHCLNNVGVKMLITTDSFKSQKYGPILDEVIPELSKSKPGKLKSTSVPTLESVVCISETILPGTIPFRSIPEKSSESGRKKLAELSKILSPDDASNIQFTSGTTGSPKGAVLSHFNIVNNASLIARRQDFQNRKHIMCFMGPLFHAMGSVIAILASAHEGITLVVPDMAFSGTKSVMAILKEKCTILLGTPTMYIDIIKILTDKGLKAETPEIALTGGAFASTVLFHDMFEKLNLKRISSVYGLTETGPVCFMSQIDDNKEKTTTTVGFIMDHTEAKVINEKGLVVPWDTPGELCIRGYNVMKGYWNDEKKTKETITPENWLKTGDKFTISEDGYGKIIGRIKDLIIRGGENIYPAELEEFLSSHPDILEVQVVGVPDKRLGEQVCACIRLKPNAQFSEETIKEFCKGKIAAYKIPQYVYFVDNFPKTSSGKIQKYILRQQAMQHFNLVENEKKPTSPSGTS